MSVPGLVHTSKNRATGVQVELWDTRFMASLGADKHRWAVKCLAHDTVGDFTTQENAYGAMTSLSFCLPCQELMTSGKKYDPRTSVRAKPEQERTGREEASKPIEAMTASELMRANICVRCTNDLKGEGGHFHTTSFPVQYICCKCAEHGVRSTK